MLKGISWNASPNQKNKFHTNLFHEATHPAIHPFYIDSATPLGDKVQADCGKTWDQKILLKNKLHKIGSMTFGGHNLRVA